MSTVAEHLACLEFMLELKYSKSADLRAFSGFSMEASMFVEVHLKELVEVVPESEMREAREDVRRRVREQYHPKQAEMLLAAWAAPSTEGTATKGEPNDR